MALAADDESGTEAAGAFAADQEVGRDLTAVDWAATPLGPPETWPQSLQTAVDILLSSRFSMWMAWGPQLTFFCNAAYRRQTLGRKYPWALGRPASEVWEEIWDDIGPRIATVLATGHATWDEALLLFLERSGYPEETYHTFSYSPLRNDAGTVVGMLCVVSEDTERVIGERRMATLRDLGSDPSVIRTEQETLDFSGRQLDHNRRDLPFTLTYLFDDDGASARLAGSTGIPDGHPAAPAALGAGAADPAWPLSVLLRGESALVDLDSARFAGLPAGAWNEPPVQALVAPLARHGAPYGFLVAALSRGCSTASGSWWTRPDHNTQKRRFSYVCNAQFDQGNAHGLRTPARRLRHLSRRQDRRHHRKPQDGRGATGAGTPHPADPARSLLEP